MWAFIIAMAITYTCLWLVSFWLVWPVGVLFSLYMVTIIENRRERAITDGQILGVLLGSWLVLLYGLWLFFVS